MTQSSPAQAAPGRSVRTNSTKEQQQLRLVAADVDQRHDKLASVNLTDGTDLTTFIRTFFRTLSYLRERTDRKPFAWADPGAIIVSHLGAGVYRICTSIAASESVVGWFSQPGTVLAPLRDARPNDEWPNPSEDAFDHMAKESPDDLVRWIRSGQLTPGHLTLAAESLGSAQHPGVVRTLIDLLDSESPLIREGAVLGLGRVGSGDVVARLQDVARRDPSKSVRATACDVLDQLDDC